MDLLDRLCDRINAIPNLPMQCSIGYLLADESLVVYAEPGSKTVSEDYAGNKDMVMNYAVAVRTKAPSVATPMMFGIANELDNLQDLPSGNCSYEFTESSVTNQPWTSEQDQQGYWILLLNIQIEIEVFADAD